MTSYSDLFAVRMAHQERIILKMLLDNGPMTVADIATVYPVVCAESDIEPLVRTQIAHLRRKIEPHGYTITRNHGGRSRYGTFELVRV